MKHDLSPSILYVSSFPPRECGIATFAQDLTNAIDRELAPTLKSKILAMNPNGMSIFNYPKKVICQISDEDLQNYLDVAKKINKNSDIKLVNIQHEYGLFGGDWGNYILPFMEIINKPIVVTFHTILARPDKHLKKITQDIIAKASGVVVMTHHTAKVLRRTYGVEKKKPIAVIPHGVHHISFPSKTESKKKLSLSGHTVITTFGMLSRDKGIEYAIEAMPAVVAKYPNVLYLVLGATHPNVVRHDGEVYRNKLVRLVKKLKLEDHVKFYNKYLDLEELIDYLKATDIYVSPTQNPRQAVSGTVSYALSCACPIVVTASQFAKDVINNERGRLVGFNNSVDITKSVLEILDDPIMYSNMKKDTYYYSRHMTWQNVALSYFKFFNQFAKIVPREPDKLPPISLAHIKTLTDEFGMLQFARHTKPDPHSGYCLDDNARALIGCIRRLDTRPSKGLIDLINVYFTYLKKSQRADGHFDDFINHNRTINGDLPESEDSFGRAIWALGVAVGSQELNADLSALSLSMFKKSLPVINELKFSRAIAFAIIGLSEAYTRVDETLKNTISSLIKELGDKLLARFQEQTNISGKEGDKWRWFDDHLTYSNYKIPEALFRAYVIVKDRQYLSVAKESLDFLSNVSFDKGYYNAIGQDGWYFREGKRAYFDQQPEDAASAVEALTTAYKVTNTKKYVEEAKLAFGWFLGKNHLSQMVYDEATGGCYDGLGKHSLNFNQGAESTLSYFLARLAMEDLSKNKK